MLQKLILGITVVLFTSIGAQSISLQTFASGFSQPVDIAHAGDSRLFVVEKGGNIKIVQSNGTTLSTPFLSIPSLVSTGSERGLLGLAFHPNYSSNGYFYINYTNTSGHTVIARYTVSSGNSNVANTASAQILLTITQPFSNHNGGCLRFGPDGKLYIGMGDGGSAGDPNNNSQNINSLLGKMLRIDVDSASPYGIPSNNPYVGIAGADEIWSVGLRNPWKFSFDFTTGDIWIGDVGQNAFEEINKFPYTTSNLNYGWRCYEANQTYNTSGCGAANTFHYPEIVYDHSNSACSVTGGYRYRGTQYPNFSNLYFFADYCNNTIGMYNVTTQTTVFSASFSGNFSTFGEDLNKELYIAGISNGVIYKITDATAGIDDIDSNQQTKILLENSISHSTAQLVPNSYVSIEIYNLSGQILQTKTQDFDTIYLHQIPKGTYFIKAVLQDGTHLVQRFIIT